MRRGLWVRPVRLRKRIIDASASRFELVREQASIPVERDRDRRVPEVPCTAFGCTP